MCFARGRPIVGGFVHDVSHPLALCVGVGSRKGSTHARCARSHTKNGPVHWLLLLVHVWPLVHVAVPQAHGVLVAAALPSVVEHVGPVGQ